MLQSKAFRIALLLVCMSVIGFNIWFFRPLQNNRQRSDGRIALNKDEFAFNDLRDHVVGDPQKTVEQMRSVIYRDMEVYFKRHGHYPLYTSDKDSVPSFAKDRMDAYTEYGYKSKRDAFRGHVNPDAQYADGTRGVKNVDPYMHPLLRPDGTKFGEVKEPGTRDLLAFTRIYFYHNERFSTHADMTTEDPTGFYLVLWEDGQVEKVDWQKVRYFKPTGLPCFPGQAGAPLAKTMNYADWRKWSSSSQGFAAVAANKL